MDVEVSRKDRTAGLLKPLVAQFATVVRCQKRGPTSLIVSGGGTNLKAPRSDSTYDVHMLIWQFKEVSDLNGWNDCASLAQLCMSI